ncbi:hypothetical protein ACHAWO_003478 [Cyclotella atomus]|uniref:Uncharacterized protein n=1 Tax=Cyclotella atomus TaxID=382360 RepID=A0ABD3NJ57_9STRA
MMDVVQGAVKTGDVFLVVTDASESYNNVGKNKDDLEEEPEEDSFLGIGEDLYEKPVIVCVNKVDTVAEDSSTVCENTPLRAIETIQKWRALLPDAFAILPTCAAGGPDDPGVLALRSILSDVAAISVVGQTYRTDRFCASELIRETLFEKLGKELPLFVKYSDEDETDEGNDTTKKRKSMIKIGATIFGGERFTKGHCSWEEGGNQIKEVGMDARRNYKSCLGQRITHYIALTNVNTDIPGTKS